MKIRIIGLIGWAFIGLSAAALANPEIIAGLKEQGYFASEKLADTLPHGLLAELQDVFSQVAWVNPLEVHSQSTHANAFQQIWDLEIDHQTPYSTFIGIKSALGTVVDFPNPVADLVTEVFASLEPGTFGVELRLVNDFAVKTAEMEHRLLSPLATGSFSSGADPLQWHQDYASIYKIDYLYFLIIEATSQLAHTISLGKTKSVVESAVREVVEGTTVTRQAYASGADESDVTVVWNKPGIAGAGYFIDQNFRDTAGNMIVHTHSGYRHYINRYDPDDIEIQQRLLRRYKDRAEEALHPKNNLFSSEKYPTEYERQQRLKVIMRIERIS